MRKQELVHLHALCSLIRSHVEARADPPPGTFDDYEELGVAPTTIYRQKRAHRRAVLQLLDDVTSAIPAEELPQATASTETSPEGD